MTKIESKTVSVNHPAESVYNYLINMNHLDQLLPMDKLSNFSASEKECKFKVSGAANIELFLHECTPNDKVSYKTGGSSTFPFVLNVHIKSTGDESCEVSQIAEAELNAFMKAMVMKPLTKLFDYIADRLPKAMA